MPTTKYKQRGIRSRIRFEPPTLDDAILAAALAENLGGRTEIAAMLMGVRSEQLS